MQWVQRRTLDEEREKEREKDRKKQIIPRYISVHLHHAITSQTKGPANPVPVGPSSTVDLVSASDRPHRRNIAAPYRRSFAPEGTLPKRWAPFRPSLGFVDIVPTITLFTKASGKSRGSVSACSHVATVSVFDPFC